jgi:hypothetical protein
MKLIIDKLRGGRAFGAQGPWINRGIKVALSVDDLSVVANRDNPATTYGAAETNTGELIVLLDGDSMCVCMHNSCSLGSQKLGN